MQALCLHLRSRRLDCYESLNWQHCEWCDVIMLDCQHSWQNADITCNSCCAAIAALKGMLMAKPSSTDPELSMLLLVLPSPAVGTPRPAGLRAPLPCKPLLLTLLPMTPALPRFMLLPLICPATIWLKMSLQTPEHFALCQWTLIVHGEAVLSYHVTSQRPGNLLSSTLDTLCILEVSHPSPVIGPMCGAGDKCVFTISVGSGGWYPGLPRSNGTVDSVMLMTDTWRVTLIVSRPSCNDLKTKSQRLCTWCRVYSHVVNGRQPSAGCNHMCVRLTGHLNRLPSVLNGDGCDLVVLVQAQDAPLDDFGCRATGTVSN
jgi:hypothetical protein